MRTRLIISGILASLALGGVAGAEPAPPAGPRPGTDSVHVTMTAGKGRLGVSVLQISSELRGYLGAPLDRGVLVDTLRPDSPAARAGLRVGDVIVEVDGDAIQSARDVLEALTDRKTGDTVMLGILRGGQRTDLRATLEDDPGVPWRVDPVNPQLRRWLEDEMPTFESFGGRDEIRRSLDDARKRIQELERRLQRLERTGAPRDRS